MYLNSNNSSARPDFFRVLTTGKHCWFASDVTAAMLVVRNKRVSLRWEMNSILMQILQKNFFNNNNNNEFLNRMALQYMRTVIKGVL